jgi:hypothetical protein
MVTIGYEIQTPPPPEMYNPECSDSSSGAKVSKNAETLKG